MSFQILERGNLCPVAFLLTTYGSRGDKLLFNYPKGKQKSLCKSSEKIKTIKKENAHSNFDSDHSTILHKFSYQSFDETQMRSSSIQDNMSDSIDRLKTTTYVDDNKLSPELKEDVLVSLLAVMNNFSKERFFLKLEDIIFVGNSCGSSKFSTGVIDDHQTIRTFNVVFVLKSTAPQTVQDSFYNLAKSIASAICLEEKRSLFLSKERSIIQNLSDELQEQADDGNDPLTILLEKSQLCRDLKKIVDDVCQTGVVMSKVNNMVTVCQCLPQMIYNIVDDVYVDSSDVINAANKIKPYHTLIFLTNKEDIIKYPHIFSLDFKKFINCVSVKENIAIASIKSGVSLSFCLRMATNLVLWNNAIICYPVQETNNYCIAPFINVNMDLDFLERFHRLFPSLLLPKVLLEINNYHSYNEILCALSLDEDIGAHLFEWLLVNRLIYQVHKYFILAQHDKRESFEFSKINNFLASKSKSEEETSNLLTQLMSSYPMLYTDEDYAMESAFEQDLLRMLIKILPFCNGEYHLEEIIYQINERKSEIIRCFEHYSNLIITIETSDPVTSCFVGIV